MTQIPSDQPERVLVGQTVGGRFHVTRLLARGGMAVVYEAEQTLGETKRKVALKTLRIHSTQDPTVSARFKRECETISQLTHPNTVRVYDFGETDDGILYIAMEFVPGRSLADVMEAAGPLQPTRVLEIVRQIVGSLHEAHGQGLIHRDLKPENIILQQLEGAEDIVKVLDFGIAARTVAPDSGGRLTQQGIVLGTPPYMSPEQFSGKLLDGRSDIYSLGVMTYEMLTGQWPLEASTPWTWAAAHNKEPPTPFEATAAGSQVPLTMRRAVMRALAKPPDERQATVKDFVAELAGAAGSLAPSSVVIVPGGTTGMETPPPAFGAGFEGTSPMPAAVERRVPPTALQPAFAQQAIAAAAPAARRGWGFWLALTSVLALLGVGGVLVAPLIEWPGQEELPPLPMPQPRPSASVGGDTTDTDTDTDNNDNDVDPPPRRSPAPERPSRPTAPRPAGSAVPSPSAEPTSSPPGLPPMGGAVACRSDADCGFNRCNASTSRCSWPCASDADCREGSQCFPLLGGACLYRPGGGAQVSPPAASAEAPPP